MKGRRNRHFKFDLFGKEVEIGLSLALMFGVRVDQVAIDIAVGPFYALAWRY